MLMLLAQLETIEHARFRALAQITIDSDKGIEAFEEYMKIAFPYLEATKKRDREKFLQELRKEVARGAMRITAVQQQKGKSKLKQKMMEKDKRAQRDLNSLYQKLGDTVPVHGRHTPRK